jgi:hypothetical protein
MNVDYNAQPQEAAASAEKQTPAYRCVEHVGQCSQRSQDELSELPACAQHAQCAVSCLLLWQKHVARCKRCQAHLDYFPRCTERQCRRLASIQDGQRDLQQLLHRRGFLVDGHVFEMARNCVSHMLDIDFANLHYVASSDQSSVCMNTQFAFQILACLLRVQRNLRSESGDIGVDGHDLRLILDTYVKQWPAAATDGV